MKQLTGLTVEALKINQMFIGLLKDPKIKYLGESIIQATGARVQLYPLINNLLRKAL